MWIDDADNLYLAEIEGRSIGRIDAADRRYRRIVTRGGLDWPDDILKGLDGAMYAIVSQLPCAPPLKEGKDRSQPPFAVARFRPEGR